MRYWKTESEMNIAGFHLYRSPEEKGEYSKLNKSLILPRGDPITGASYELVDNLGKAGDFYKLEVVELSGNSIFFGPVKAEAGGVTDARCRIQDAKIEISPNPFSKMVDIRYQIPESKVSLKVYDAMGKLVRTLVDEPQDMGYYRITWDGENSEGRTLGQGVYFYRFEAGDFKTIHKIVLLR